MNYAACYGNTGYNQTAMGGVAFLGGMFTNGERLLDSLDYRRRQQHLAFSEVLPGHGPYYQGPPGDGMVCEGGQAFEGYVTPNSSAPDIVCNVCPQSRADPQCRLHCLDGRLRNTRRPAAPIRAGWSRFSGTAAMRFISNSVDINVWRALCSSCGGESLDGGSY